MSRVRRIVEHFVAPVDELSVHAAGPPAAAREESATTCPRAVAPAAPAVAVLAAGADALVVGAALALALARRERAPVAALCAWDRDGAARLAWTAPARPAARRLATALAARGHDARPAGRLAVVRLPAGAHEAADDARRVLAAAGSAPAVLALGGPRSAAFDALLAEQDLVVVGSRAEAGSVLVQLALADLAGAVRACACELPASAPARSLAAAGLALSPSVRRALAEPLAELR
jgi:hypothetical protein